MTQIQTGLQRFSIHFTAPRQRPLTLRKLATQCRRHAALAQLVDHQPSKLEASAISLDATSVCDSTPLTPSASPSSRAQIEPPDNEIAAWLQACPAPLSDTARERIAAIVQGEGVGR